MLHLVLLHGWGATGAVWRRQEEVFGGTCKVHAPTLPQWDAACVLRFLEKIPPGRTVAVGWSLGGMLLLEALARSRIEPAGLILVGTPAVFCRREGHPWGQAAAAVRAMRRALQKDAPKVLADFASACLAPEETGFREEVKGLFVSDMAEDHLAAGLDYLLAADLRPVLAEIQGRTIIVQGDRDGIVPWEQGRFLHQRLSGSRLITLSGAGHLPFVTQAARFNEILKEAVTEAGINLQ